MVVVGGRRCIGEIAIVSEHILDAGDVGVRGSGAHFGGGVPRPGIRGKAVAGGAEPSECYRVRIAWCGIGEAPAVW